jgi:LysR family transcriptional regulator (chromosome initiation inhibitor)
MFPERLAAPDIRSGLFERISDAHLDVPLFWQCWKLDTALVRNITGAVVAAAAEGLV